MNERAPVQIHYSGNSQSKKCFRSVLNTQLSYTAATFPLRLYKMDEKIKNAKLPAYLEKELDRAEQMPSWLSSNEGVREKVNFDDTLWGFELAGGSYYNTPLRVTRVKHNSRAMLAGIHVGDMLQSINGINTFELTVQEAHDLILDSGIEIKLNFYAPDVSETIYSVYQDELDLKNAEMRKLREPEVPVPDLSYKGYKLNKNCGIVWPCNKKRDILYRESNCFLVPSSYEKKHSARLLKNESSDNNNKSV